MDTLNLKSREWEKVKFRLKEQFSILTDSDLDYEEGEEEQLLLNLREKLGKSKAEVKKIIRNI